MKRFVSTAMAFAMILGIVGISAAKNKAPEKTVAKPAVTAMATKKAPAKKMAKKVSVKKGISHKVAAKKGISHKAAVKK